MPDVKRTVKLITEQRVLTGEDSGVEGFPMRAWSIEIWLLDDEGRQVTPSVFEKATYKLHPTFPKPTQAFKKPPFRIEEKGWGEFDMSIVLHTVGKGGDHTLSHDLNFHSGPSYEATHSVVFKNPNEKVLAALEDIGLGVENGSRKRDEAPRKRNRKDKMVDMEKLGDGLQKLSEDDLLQVVQMIHDHKTSETYTKNDIENGEFHVDLYTLPDSLVKLLWDFTSEKTTL